MTLDEAIEKREREVPVVASQICDFLMRVRAAGGFPHAMDAGTKYTVHIIWREKKPQQPQQQQQELI